MITNGWVDWAKRIDGVPDKIYSQVNSCRAFACHSVVGRESDFEDGIPNRFFDTSRLANGRYTDNAAASVQFVLRESGALIQMYPITASTWTSGGPEANTTCMSMEAEGGLAPNYGEPLTTAAEDTFCRLMRELRPVMGPAQPFVNLFQHKDLARMYGYAPTACASDRYRNAWARAVREAQEGEVTQEEYDDLLLATFAGAEEKWEPGSENLPGPEVIGKLKPREERLRLARYRRDEAAAGRNRSVMDVSASAAARP